MVTVSSRCELAVCSLVTCLMRKGDVSGSPTNRSITCLIPGAGLVTGRRLIGQYSDTDLLTGM